MREEKRLEVVLELLGGLLRIGLEVEGLTSMSKVSEREEVL
jgi:hypothetical protein